MQDPSRQIVSALEVPTTTKSYIGEVEPMPTLPIDVINMDEVAFGSSFESPTKIYPWVSAMSESSSHLLFNCVWMLDETLSRYPSSVDDIVPDTAILPDPLEINARSAVKSDVSTVVAAPVIASCFASQVDEAAEISTPSTNPDTMMLPLTVSPVTSLITPPLISMPLMVSSVPAVICPEAFTSQLEAAIHDPPKQIVSTLVVPIITVLYCGVVVPIPT